MKNIAKNFTLNSITKWTFTNHPEWADGDRSVVTVVVERVTTLNDEVLNKRTIERQDHVVNISTAECMAAEACLRMSSINIDEEVYVGF